MSIGPNHRHIMTIMVTGDRICVVRGCHYRIEGDHSALIAPADKPSGKDLAAGPE